MSVPVVVVVCCSLTYLLFLLWYGGWGRPMSTTEADVLLERVKRNAEAAGTPFASDLFSALREVTRDDDGREFVMVNLIRYTRRGRAWHGL